MGHYIIMYLAAAAMVVYLITEPDINNNMRHLLLCLLLFPYTIFAQDIVRNGTETPASFIRHQLPDRASNVHQVIETSKWIGNTNAVIAFYTYGDSVGYALDTFETGMGYDKPVIGYLYLSKDNRTYT